MLECSKYTARKFSWGVFIVSFNTLFCSQILWPKLPSLTFSICFVFVFIVLACYTKYKSSCTGVLLGFIWSASVGYCYLYWQPQDIQFQQDVIIVGQITDIAHSESKSRLNLSVQQIGDSHFSFARRIRLNWYHPALTLKQGDKVNLVAKLKPVHGFANPFSFDYERWLLSKNITAVGYVVSKYGATISPSQKSQRSELIEQLETYQFTQQRWLLSLGFGERQQLTQSDWSMLQISGLSHLFAISGLHLGIVAGLMWWVYASLFGMLGSTSQYNRYLKYIPQYNLKPLIMLLITLSCLGYAYLANWQIPVVRAIVMLSLALLFIVLRIRLSLWQLIGLVFTVFVLVAPLSIYSNSFWLSFFAVGLIAFYSWRCTVEHQSGTLASRLLYYCKSLIRLQVLLSVLMMPFVISQFGTISILAIGINIIAVPFVTLIVVPICLLGVGLMLFGIPFDFLVFSIANSLIEYFFVFVKLAVSFESLVWTDVALSSISLVLLFLGLLLVFLPRFVCQRRIFLILIMPTISEILVEPTLTNGWQLHVLDVGQGTAIVISQSGGLALIDAGAKFPGGFNMGDAVVLPFVKQIKKQGIDYLIVSHYDNDHAGSLPIIERNISIGNRITPDNCVRGQAVQWKRLTIQVLWPSIEAREQERLSDNNLSCVIKVSDGNRAVLLPGDIEREAEYDLIESSTQILTAGLASEVLIAPHHGSKTSSSLLFAKRVSPKHVVYTTGYLNRWKFPNPEVVGRYARLESKQWNTATDGYIRFSIPYNQSNEIEAVSWRDHLYPRWYNGRMKD